MCRKDIGVLPKEGLSNVTFTHHIHPSSGQRERHTMRKDLALVGTAICSLSAYCLYKEEKSVPGQSPRPRGLWVSCVRQTPVDKLIFTFTG